MGTAAEYGDIDRREYSEPAKPSLWRINNWRDLRDLLAIVALAIAALGFGFRQAGAYDTRVTYLENNMRAVAYMTCAVFGKQYPDLKLPRECDAAVSQGAR